MATINLTTLPAHHQREPGRAYTSTVIELLGDCLGRQRAEAKSVAEIRGLVKTFGDAVARQHPERSFMVSVSVAKGSRKPGGFDAANARDGLGQQTWMRTIDQADPLHPSLVA